MTRNLSLLISAAAIVFIPHVAWAGCNGTGCQALSSTSNYSAPDKRVRATVTNKDASNPVKLKFCVNVDYHCNGFEATLAPRETITRDVPFKGTKPPQIHAVDVVTAEFPAQSASSGAGNAGASAIAFDTPRGKVVYLAAKKDVAQPLLKKATDFFKTVDDNYLDGQRHADKMHELSDKLGTVKDIEREIAMLRNKDGGRVKDQAHIAQGAELQLSHFKSTLKLAGTNASYAASNLKITEDDLRGARDMERARELRADADKAQTGFNVIFNLINTAADTAIVVMPVTDPGSKVNSAVANIQKVFDVFGSNPWLEEAAKLEARAQKMGMANAEKKFAAAKVYMTSLKQQLSELQSKLPAYESLVRDARGAAEEGYDKIAQGQKSGNSFKFETLEQATSEAQRTIDYARKVTEAAYGTRAALKQLGESSGWMAFPSDARSVMNKMDSESKEAFDWGVKERQSAEALLKKFNEMYMMARTAMQ
ncbi:MAG: hypothetical protein JWR89_3889 [Tardiphaga sp.]|uniref:hypothetical protein n=1 Tax=Tardiphaga sp. TaxID=1926292 RepID=UPI0026166D0D|nr:hypothetical protein [Tardiphaga sp.]MDB5503987.1 hypothetical protein [Tardiphaga sp.]